MEDIVCRLCGKVIKQSDYVDTKEVNYLCDNCYNKLTASQQDFFNKEMMRIEGELRDLKVQSLCGVDPYNRID